MTERELFLYELNGHGYEFKNKTFINGLGGVGGVFEDDQLNMAWEMWQASASREGYKLVPVDLLGRCMSHIGIASCHPANNLNDDLQMSNDIDELEKAIMGVVE